MIQLDATVGRARDLELAQATQTLEVILEDRGRRRTVDQAENALNLVRVEVSDPRGDGYYRRTFILHSGQRVLLDMATVDAVKVRVLAVEGCADGRQIVVSQLDQRPPEVAERVLDVVTYEVTSITTQRWTPPQGARRWWAVDPSGTGIGPVPGKWRLSSSATLTAGGVEGEVLGPAFTFDKTGTAVLVWEIVP